MDRAATYTTNEVIRVSGMTARQVQYWAENGGLAGQRLGTGNPRVWTRDALLMILVIDGLRRRGLTLTVVRRLMPVVRNLAGEYLVTDGLRATWLLDAAAVIEWLKRSRGGWMVSLADLKSCVDKA